MSSLPSVSFQPLSTQGTSLALIGAADPVKFTDTNRPESDRTLYDKRIHGPKSDKSTFIYTLVIVIISAILFVTMVAIYDVFRNSISDVYARRALTDEGSSNTPDEINGALIANRQALIASGFFALFC